MSAGADTTTVDRCPYCGGVAPLHLELLELLDADDWAVPVASGSCGACGVEVCVLPVAWLPPDLEWQEDRDEDAD